LLIYVFITDELRARHMAHTKHAVVLSPSATPRAFSPLDQHSSDFRSSAAGSGTEHGAGADRGAEIERGAGTERTGRAMTFDTPYSTFLPQRVTFDPHAAIIPPYHQRGRRAGSVASPHYSPLASPAPIAAPAPPSPHSPRNGASSPRGTPPSPHAPQSGSTSPRGAPPERLNKIKKTSKNNIYHKSNASNISSLSSSSLSGGDVEDSGEIEPVFNAVRNPTPRMSRYANQAPLSSRQLEWEASVRSQLGGDVDVKKVSLLEVMKLKHTWISVWFTQRSSRLTCVEQLTILLCMVCFFCCSLLVARCSLLVARCSLLVVFCSLFVVRCSLFVVRCSLFVVRCSLFVVRCSLFVVRCSLFIRFYP
jgi:hypothetical protein